MSESRYKKIKELKEKGLGTRIDKCGEFYHIDDVLKYSSIQQKRIEKLEAALQELRKQSDKLCRESPCNHKFSHDCTPCSYSDFLVKSEHAELLESIRETK